VALTDADRTYLRALEVQLDMYPEMQLKGPKTRRPAVSERCLQEGWRGLESQRMACSARTGKPAWSSRVEISVAEAAWCWRGCP
jgi:hypothetical protein